MIVLVVILLLSNVVIAYLAYRFWQQRNDYRRGFETRGQSIEETRAGNPPFLLNRGVRIVKD